MAQRPKWQPTQEDLQRFLAWLDPDPAKAADKYLLIGQKLHQYFANRHCSDTGHLVDKTIDRVMQKLPEKAAEYVGEPMKFIHRVAHYIYLEHQHEIASQPVVLPTPLIPSDDEIRCLEQCLQELNLEEKQFILDYYRHEGQRKIEWHEKMAEERGIEIGALRNRAFRLRKKLAPCAHKCRENKLT